LIADPYSYLFHVEISMSELKKSCLRCKKDIKAEELHKIVMYVVQEKFTEHHYEHIECPEKFTV